MGFYCVHAYIGKTSKQHASFWPQNWSSYKEQVVNFFFFGDSVLCTVTDIVNSSKVLKQNNVQEKPVYNHHPLAIANVNSSHKYFRQSSLLFGAPSWKISFLAFPSIINVNDQLHYVYLYANVACKQNFDLWVHCEFRSRNVSSLKSLLKSVQQFSYELKKNLIIEFSTSIKKIDAKNTLLCSD